MFAGQTELVSERRSCRAVCLVVSHRHWDSLHDEKLLLCLAEGVTLACEGREESVSYYLGSKFEVK